MPASVRRSVRGKVLVGILCVILGVTSSLAFAAPVSAAPTPAFTGWTSWAEGGADVAFAGDTSQPHSGTRSLRIVDASPLAGGVYGAISQEVHVEPSTTYQFRLWVRGSGVASGAGFVVTDNAGTRTAVPSGTFGWQEITWTRTTGASDTTIPVIIAVQDVATLWFDDFSMTKAGATASLVENGGFEEVSNPIAIGVSDMFFDAGDAVLPIETADPQVTWVARDVDGAQVAAGSLDTSSGTATLDLRALPAGYYTLSLASATTSRETSLTVVDGLSAQPDPETSRFGTTLHPLVHRGTRQDVMTAELGAGAARVDVRWDVVEKTAGQFDWTETDVEIARLIAKGILPVLVLAYYGPYDGFQTTPWTEDGIEGFAGFAGAAAARYGTDAAYQIYNEYNFGAVDGGYSNGGCGQTAACYLKLLEQAAAAVHAVDAAALVVGPEIAGETSWWLDTKQSLTWLEEFLAGGGLQHVDVLTVHNYAGKEAPEGHNDEVIRDIVALMDEYDATEPLWLDETGYFTSLGNGVTERQQAAYLVRDALLSLQAGADRYFVYDMLDDWNDPYAPEGNFGLVRNPVSQQGLLAPKPAFTSMAVLTRLLGGHAIPGSGALEDIGGGNHSVVLEGAAGSEVRALWSEVTSVVGLSATGPVTVTDLFGRSSQLTPVDGRLLLPIDGDPVYVSGPGLAVDEADADGISVSVPAASYEGVPLPVTVRVDRTHDTGGVRTIEFREHGGTASVTVQAPAGAVTTGTLSASASSAPGERSMVVDVAEGGAVIGVRAGLTDAAPNPVADFLPISSGAAAVRADVDVRYVSPAGPATISTTDWTIGGQSGASAPGTPFDANDTARVQLDATGVPTWTPVDYTVDLGLSTGTHEQISGRTAFAPAGAYGQAPAAYADLDASGTWVTLGGDRSGAADLSGAMWVAWNQDVLSVNAVVIDDTHRAASVPADLWKGDSIQFGVGDWPVAPSSARQVGVALVGGTPVVYDYTGTGAPLTGATANVTRNGNGTTSYLATIPWSALGRSGPSDHLGYSFLVNDDDGAGREGFLEWGGGIGTGKDLSRYLPIQLVP